MTLKELKKHINKVIKEMIGKELDENLFHMTATNQNVMAGGIDNIENIFPEYSEEDGTFIPQRVSEKQY